jgi:hypothetical protein
LVFHCNSCCTNTSTYFVIAHCLSYILSLDGRFLQGNKNFAVSFLACIGQLCLYLYSSDILKALLQSFSTDFFRLFFGFSTDPFSIQHHPLFMLRFSIRSTRSAHYIRVIYRHSAQSLISDCSVRCTPRPVNWSVTVGTSNRGCDIYYLVSFI